MVAPMAKAAMAALKADSDSAMVAIFGEEHKDLVLTSDRAASSATRAKILGAMQTLRVLQAPSPCSSSRERRGPWRATPARYP